MKLLKLAIISSFLTVGLNAFGNGKGMNGKKCDTFNNDTFSAKTAKPVNPNQWMVDRTDPKYTYIKNSGKKAAQ